MYCVDYQIMDEEWVTLAVPFEQSDVLDALMDVWIERDKFLKEPCIFRLSSRMSELWELEQKLLAPYL